MGWDGPQDVCEGLVSTWGHSHGVSPEEHRMGGPNDAVHPWGEERGGEHVATFSPQPDPSPWMLAVTGPSLGGLGPPGGWDLQGAGTSGGWDLEGLGPPGAGTSGGGLWPLMDRLSGQLP